MAKFENQAKQTVYIEYQSNHTKAIQELEAVKAKLGDNVSALDEVEQAQFRLNDELRRFEKALSNADDDVDDFTKSNEQLSNAITRLERRMNEAQQTLQKFNAEVNDGGQVKLANKLDDAGDAAKDAAKNMDELVDSNNSVKTSSSEASESLLNQTGSLELLDQAFFGIPSKVKQFVLGNNSIRGALKASSVEFSTLSTKAKIATVATNAFSLGMKTLIAGTGIGLLVLAVTEIASHWEDIVEWMKEALNEQYKINKAAKEQLEKEMDHWDIELNRNEQRKLAGETESMILANNLSIREQQLQNIKKQIEAEYQMHRLQKKWYESLVNFSIGAMAYAMDIFSTITAGIERTIGAMKYIITLGKSGEITTPLSDDIDKIAKLLHDYEITDWRKDDKDDRREWDSTTEGREAAKRLNDAKEEYARLQNEMNAYRERIEKEVSDSRKKQLEEELKKLEERQKAYEEYLKKVKAWNDELRNILNDTAILKAENDFFKRLAELNKEVSDIQAERIKKEQELLEVHKKGSAEYKKSMKIINEYYDLQLKAVEKQKDAIGDTVAYYESLSRQILEGENSLKDMTEMVDKFLDSIEDSEVKDHWSKLLGIEEMRNALTLLDSLKEGMADYTFEIEKSFQQNSDNARLTYEFNSNLLRAEYEEKMASIPNGQQYNELRLAVERDFYNKLDAEAKKHNDAQNAIIETRRELQLQTANAVVDSLGALNEAMGENFEAQKAIDLASTVINTAAAVMAIQKQYPGPPGYVMMASTIASGLASAIKIINTRPDNAESQAGSMGSLEASGPMPNVQFIQSAESQLAQTVQQNMYQQQPIEAYVVSKNITNAQQLNYAKQSNASL